MRKTSPPIYQYSRLRYEDVSHKKNGKARCWYLEQGASPLELSFTKLMWDSIKEVQSLLIVCLLKIIKLLKRGFVVFKKHYRKEFLFSFIITLTFSSKSYALVPTVPPKVLPQPYIHLIQPLKPIQAVQFVVPVEIAPVPVPQPVAIPVVSSVVSGCGDNFYANYIYMHESGCSLTITNSIGCLGIGQACPSSKLYATCPVLTYACENQFFTAYSAKYGGWLGSYNFWVANHWW